MITLGLPVPNRNDAYAMQARRLRDDIRWCQIKISGIIVYASPSAKAMVSMLMAEISDLRAKVAMMETGSAEIAETSLEDILDDDWNSVD